VEGLTHGASERVVLINGAEKFVSMNPDRVGTAFNYKVVTTNQDIADASPISFIWTGQSLRAAPPADLNAVHDSSGDFFISAVGHPTEAERPESYVGRVTRDSTNTFLRDIPIVPGVRMAAILAHIIHADGGGTWSGSTHAIISNNNVIGETNPTAAYVTQPVTLGTEINARITLTPPPSPFLTGEAQLSFGPSDFTDPFGTATGVIFTTDGNSTTETHITVFDWDTAQEFFVDLPTVDGIVYVRVVWSGTELRWQFSGSPISASAKPDVILKGIAPTDPTFLRLSLHNGGPSGASAVKVENITLGGAALPQTIYSLAQQENDNGAGIATGDLRVEMWQVSPLAPNGKGLSVKGVF
jgi:hypothetical protein